MLLDFGKKLERLADFAVHFVDEGDDGRIARTADLQQPDRLGLDAVGGVDHHERGVHRREHAVGVFRKILVPRRIQQIDDAVAVFHLHDGRRDRNAALLFDFHPVRRRMPRGLARLDATGDLDGACEQQELFGQSRLARIGVRNDGERASARDFGRDTHGADQSVVGWQLVQDHFERSAGVRGRAPGLPAGRWAEVFAGRGAPG